MKKEVGMSGGNEPKVGKPQMSIFDASLARFADNKKMKPWTKRSSLAVVKDLNVFVFYGAHFEGAR